MSSLTAIAMNIFILVLFLGIYLSLLSLPGAIVVFLNILAYALISGFDRIGIKIILFLLVICIIAEAIDFVLDVTETLRALPTRTSILISAGSGFVGAAVLTPWLFGPGMLLGFFLGSLAGILGVEMYRQSKLKIPFQASYSSFFAMAGGKMLKGALTLGMVAVSLINIYS